MTSRRRTHPDRRAATAFAVLSAASILTAPFVAESDPPRIPPSIHELLEPPLLHHAEISPSGRFTATLFKESSRNGLRIRDLTTGHEVEIENPDRRLHETGWVDSISWDAEQSLIVEYDWSEDAKPSSDSTRIELIELDPKERSRVGFVRKRFRQAGKVVESTPREPASVIFAPAEQETSVYRVAIATLLDPQFSFLHIDEKAANAPVRLARFNEPVIYWLPDRKGEIRATLTIGLEPIELHLWYRDDAKSKWRIVRRESDVDRFDDLVPLGFADDDRHLLVASAIQRDRYGLYEFDPKTNSLGKLIYEHPSCEIVDLIFDDQRRAIIVVYLEDGERRYAHLSGDDDPLALATKAFFPDSDVTLTGMSFDRKRVSLRVTKSDDPGQFVVLDLESRAITPIGRIRPWLDDNLLAEVTNFSVRGREGTELDAFLTLPLVETLSSSRSTGKPPLVVMPHGGPIGVADLRAYSPEVQYLARSGFAVLQVNYRGSGGYGRRFLEAGHRQWGRGIEDDVDAAVDHAIEKGWVDARRMCVSGASYGGYSALMTVIRHPKRYRCAASFAGVTDIALMFNSDEIYGGEYVTKEMTKIVGDPEKDYEEMRRYSPVYNADRIEVPIFMAHGEWDRRVDLDHMMRMKLALDLAKVPTRAVIYPETGHGFATRDAYIRHLLNLYDFLAPHLKH